VSRSVALKLRTPRGKPVNTLNAIFCIDFCFSHDIIIETKGNKMITLEWYGGSPKAVIRFGFEPRYYRHAIGNCCGQKMFGYTSDAWYLNFLDDPIFNALWFFDNSIPVCIFGD
jgi:hypothetical protein